MSSSIRKLFRKKLAAKHLIGGVCVYLFGAYATASILGPELNKDEINFINSKDIFEFLAGSYDKLMDWEEFWGGIKRHRQKIAKLVEGKVAEVLANEVASGTARNFEYYQDEQFKFYRRKSYQESSGSNVARAQLISRVTFMDSSEAMLLIAAGKIKELNESKPEEYHVEPEFIKINCEDMKEIHENTYDTVVQTFGLCSTDRPESVLKEIERICKKNGKIILLEHGKSKYTWLNYVLNRRAPYHAKRWGCWHNKDIEKLVKDSGMSIELESRHHLGTTYFYVLRPNSC